MDEKIIDDILKNSNSNDEFIDETIYIIQYPEGKLSVSYGILKDIPVDKKYEFIHSCCTKKGSSGSPILNLSNKVIGIHKEKDFSNYNNGSFLNEAIKEFFKKKENENLLNNFYKKHKS